jgi:hypothetical protein
MRGTGGREEGAQQMTLGVIHAEAFVKPNRLRGGSEIEIDCRQNLVRLTEAITVVVVVVVVVVASSMQLIS